MRADLDPGRRVATVDGVPYQLTGGGWYEAIDVTRCDGLYLGRCWPDGTTAPGLGFGSRTRELHRVLEAIRDALAMEARDG